MTTKWNFSGPRTLVLFGVLGVSLVGSARAETKAIELSLAAGTVDRVNTPVRVALSEAQGLAGMKSATVQDANGKSWPAQVTVPSLLSAGRKDDASGPLELHFIVPELKAGQTLAVKAVLSTDAPAQAEGFQWKDTAGQFTELSFRARPVLRYMYEKLDDSTKEARERTYKVFHHVYDPAGTRIVTKGPGGQYTHHRGLYFGFNKITYGDGKKKCDTWHCSSDAHQSHQRFVSSDAGPVLGRHCVEIDWGVGKEVFAKECCELTVYNVPGGQLIEFASQLRTLVGPVTLDGDPQHAGFHFRADNEVSAMTAKKTYYLRPDGKGAAGQTRNWPGDKPHVNLPWNCMSFELGNKRYTAAYLDRPSNPKEARFSERDYGRFGSYFEYTLGDATPLKLNYRIWLQDGEMTVPQAAVLDGNFVTPVDIGVK